MGIAGLGRRAVGTALSGVLGWASRRRSRSEEWIVDCPNTDTTTAITLDVAGRVTGCCYWPQRKNCDQSCTGVSLQL